MKEITDRVGTRGIDCILDFVGGPYLQKNLKLLARNGRLVQIAFLQGAKVELDCLPILTKNLTFTGSMLRPRSIGEKPLSHKPCSRMSAALYRKKIEHPDFRRLSAK